MDLLLSAREQLGRAMLRELLAGLRRTHLAYCGRSAGENKVSGKIFSDKGPVPLARQVGRAKDQVGRAKDMVQ